VSSPQSPPSLTGTRARIVAAALDLFAERGFAQATTAEIARRAGVAEKTLFSHFKTKEALFDQALTPAALELFIAEVSPNHSGILEESWEGLEDFLVALLKNRIGLIAQHPSKFKLILQELLLRPERAQPFRAKFESEIAPRFDKIFRQLRKKGELGDVEPEVLRRMVGSILFGYSINRFVLAPQRRWDDAKEIRMMVKALVEGFKPRRAARPVRAGSTRSRAR
jgi:AcrR family transcriptional regulator